MRAHFGARRGLLWAPPLAIPLAVMLLSIGANEVSAAPIKWRAENFVYVAEEKPLADFLREFAASQGINAVISEGVNATISGKFNRPPARVLQDVASSFGLIWYHDGSILYIYSANEAASQVIRLRLGTAESLERMLELFDIPDARYPIQISRPDRVVRVSGPKRYVELIETLAATVDENAGMRPSRFAVQVFPLKYAWAQDFVVVHAGKEVVVPGVTTTLRRLFPAHPLGTAASSAAPAVSPFGRAKGLRLAGAAAAEDDEDETNRIRSPQPLTQPLRVYGLGADA